MIALRLLGYLWALPATLLGALLLPFCGPRWVAWRGGALEVGVARIAGFESTSGQTHGWLVLLHYDRADEVPARLRRHELRHVAQGMVGGPLFVLAYVAVFLVGLVRWRSAREAYWRSWFERDAREREREHEHERPVL